MNQPSHPNHSGNDRHEMLPFLPRGITSVLDVGCSDGLFGALLASERPGVVVDGVEPDRAMAVIATPRVRRVYTGYFPEVLPTGQKYDCITFLDSLEHMPDPWDALAAAREHLMPGGHVVASIPNIRHIHALTTIVKDRDWPWEDSNIFDRTHLRWFTQKSALRLFEQSGFLVDDLRFLNEWSNLKTRVWSRVLGPDIAATQFAVIASPR